MNDSRLDPVATTARVTAAMRARESERPDRLFHDPLAARLAGDQGFAMLEYADAGDAIPIRTRWFDTTITEAVRGGIGQLVLVAAGMDTRAYRLGLPGGTTVFELDRPEMLDLKADLIDAEPDVARVAVPVDLVGDWPATLTGAGHDPTAPTCWLVEGLLQYLTEPDVGALFDRLADLSAPGSRLLADLVSAELLAALARTDMLTTFAARGMPWLFATDEPAGLFTARGWTPEVHTFREVAGALGRPTVMPGVAQEGFLVAATR